jgi:hypothetical protein
MRTKDGSVRLEYELIPEDWGAFVDYCTVHSKPSRKVSRTVRWVGSIAFSLMSIIMWQARGLVWFVGCVFLVTAWWVYAPHLFRLSVRRQAMAHKRPCLRGRHTMEAVNDGVRASCDVSESLHRWAGIREVAKTQAHVFLLIGDSMGYTIPRERVLSGDIDAFADAVRSKVSR